MKDYFKKPDLGLLIIRLGLGAFMMVHGINKFMGGPSALKSVGGAMAIFGITFLPLFWGILGALIESLGGFLFMLGFKFRIAAFFLFAMMAVATAYNFDGLGTFMKYAWSTELAIVFLGMLFVGPGKYSADKN